METLENCRISPPRVAVAAGDLPLTFLDAIWFSAPPVQRVFFYNLPYPSSHLSRTVVVDLKNSLAVTLGYFYPFAGNIVFPPQPPKKPYISCEEGGSVWLTVVESKYDFEHLSGDHPRQVADIQALVPRLPPLLTDEETSEKNTTLMGIQITLFPDFGISIGVTYVHAVADGRSFSNFMKTWAEVHRSRGNASYIPSTALPCHDRHLIKDDKGITSRFIKDMFCFQDVAPGPSNKNMHVTFKMSSAKITMLKELVKTRLDHNNEGEAESLHVSTFVVCVAYIWVCLTKLEDQRTGCEDDDSDALCHLIFLTDCRGRLLFPIPTAYFGNCISPFFLAAKKCMLVAENGLVFAARTIAKEVQRAREEPLLHVEDCLSKLCEIVKTGRYFLTIAGSPKFRVYDTDFGWGKPRKTDCAHIVSYGAVCIDDGGRDDEVSIELGLVVDQSELGTLTALFEGLSATNINTQDPH